MANISAQTSVAPETKNLESRVTTAHVVVFIILTIAFVLIYTVAIIKAFIDRKGIKERNAARAIGLKVRSRFKSKVSRNRFAFAVPMTMMAEPATPERASKSDSYPARKTSTKVWHKKDLKLERGGDIFTTISSEL